MVVGIVYGWYIRPARAKNLNLDALRADYQADYVLMVAEAYQSPDEMAVATSHLLRLADSDPLQLVQEVLVTAQELEYSQRDMQLLSNLATNLKNRASVPLNGSIE